MNRKCGTLCHSVFPFGSLGLLANILAETTLFDLRRGAAKAEGKDRRQSSNYLRQGVCDPACRWLVRVVSVSALYCRMGGMDWLLVTRRSIWIGLEHTRFSICASRDCNNDTKSLQWTRMVHKEIWTKSCRGQRSSATAPMAVKKYFLWVCKEE